MFLKRVKSTISGTGCTTKLNITSYDETSDLNCFTYSDDSAECKSRDAATNALTASIFFAVLHMVVLAWSARVGAGTGTIDAKKLRASTWPLLLLAFPLFLSCFITAGNYRSFLIGITSYTDASGVTYSIEWTMCSAWVSKAKQSEAKQAPRFPIVLYLR